jgi:hypothetical protein
MVNLFESFSRDLAGKPQAEQAQAVKDSVATLTHDQKKAVAQALSDFMPKPDQTTGNKLWVLAIWFFAIVMIGSALVLSIGLFVLPVAGGTKVETILLLFTTSTAFLAGLFAPSPVANH